MCKIKCRSSGPKVTDYIQNSCEECGWQGALHYAHNDYQHSNARLEEKRREVVCGRRVDNK